MTLYYSSQIGISSQDWWLKWAVNIFQFSCL